MEGPFYLVGQVYKFSFKKKLVNDLVDIFKMSDCGLDPVSASDKKGLLNYLVTIPSKQTRSVEASVRRWVRSHTTETIKSSVNYHVVGRKYQMKFPEKMVKKLARVLKQTYHCHVFQVTVNEGDGKVNIHITMPANKSLVVRNYIKSYIKEFNIEI